MGCLPRRMAGRFGTLQRRHGRNGAVRIRHHGLIDRTIRAVHDHRPGGGGRRGGHRDVGCRSNSVEHHHRHAGIGHWHRVLVDVLRFRRWAKGRDRSGCTHALDRRSLPDHSGHRRDWCGHGEPCPPCPGRTYPRANGMAPQWDRGGRAARPRGGDIRPDGLSAAFQRALGYGGAGSWSSLPSPCSAQGGSAPRPGCSHFWCRLY